MQFNIISYTLFLFLMVMFFPSLIYAPWTEDDPPTLPPDETTELTCAGWIHFNGFVLGEYSINRDKAMDRDINYDRKASRWAAGYAFKIGGTEEIYQITPQEFCNSFGNVNRVPKRFRSLEDDYENCKSWIKLYGFSNDVEDNKLYAGNTTESKAKYMSIYAYGYWSFLLHLGDRPTLNPSEYCSIIGVYELQHPFQCPYTAYKTCMEWMMLYEFDLLPTRILQKVHILAMNMGSFPFRIHFFPDLYGFDLLAARVEGQTEEEINQYTAFQFCLPYRGAINAPQRYTFYFAHML